jgi:hypothetical protein
VIGNDIEIKFTGPMFDGRSGDIFKKMADDCQTAVANQADAVWQIGMELSFKWPTGYYQSNVNIARRGENLVVNDSGVVYGPWLERGAANGNSDFKGYHLRQATINEVGDQVSAICEPIVEKAVEKMNHE